MCFHLQSMPCFLAIYINLNIGYLLINSALFFAGFLSEFECFHKLKMAETTLL